MPIYIYRLCNATYFVTFPEVATVRCSRKYLFLKYGRKIRAEFLEMLEAAIFFQGFAVLMVSSLTQFCGHTQIYAFFVVRISI